ncbi:MAG: EF-P lysine aminoacylase EpmA [Candidatus Pacebacteria bacterium]|nr:EF-P lysine aminoacylase EpmA [Candidatus Paceibacterota bacterium]
MDNWEKIKKNPGLKEIQVKRSKICELIRDFFKNDGFLEMQTPAIVKCAGQEPYLTPLEVCFKDNRGKEFKGFLVTSPEYSLKKILSAGFKKVFELAKVFRSDEKFGGLHNPEFTMLEWYRAHSDYRQIMKDVENLVLFLNKKINHSKYLNFQGQKINLTPPWPKISVKEAFLKYAKINLDKAHTIKSFSKQITKKEYLSSDWNNIFYSVFLNEIEPNLPKDRPQIIYDYPLPQASLSKRKGKSFYAERFEVYIGGMELANAFSELNDPGKQMLRFVEEQKLRKKMGKNFVPIDEKFIYALRLGMPPSGGIALGLERLQMLLLNLKDVDDLLIFPSSQLFQNHD